VPNWLTNFVLPKIRAVVRRSEVPDNLWRQCPGCEQTLFGRDLATDLMVCRHCGHHFRIGSGERFKLLFDGGAFEKVELPKTAVDPLRFRDRKRYTERLREGQAALGANSEAVSVARGRIGGVAAVIAAFDFAFMGGSMGVAVGGGIVAAAQLAVERQAALIVIPSSGGARMQEGILSLMQMPRTIIAADLVKEARLPYIVVLTDPTTGGVAASFAVSRFVVTPVSTTITCRALGCSRIWGVRGEALVVCLALVMAVAVALARLGLVHLGLPAGARLAALVLLGIVVYGALLLVWAPNVIGEFRSLIRRRA